MIKVSENLKKLAGKFTKPLYIVGGFVRDSIMGHKSEDIDLCSALKPEEVIKICKSLKFDVAISNEKLGTLRISTASERYEYSIFRKEVYSGGSHTPTQVEFIDDIRQDAKRRDFTINAIYYDIMADKIIDFYDGVKDIKRGVIKCIETPKEVLKVDSARLLRMVRFAVTLDFKIDKDTFKEAKQKAYMLKDLSAERKLKELNYLVVADNKWGLTTNKAFEYFNKLELYSYLFNFPIKIKVKDDFMWLKLSDDDRIKGFIFTLLNGKYDEKFMSPMQVESDVMTIMSSLNLSTIETKSVLKMYLVLQTLKHKLLDNFVAVSFKSLSPDEQKIVGEFVDIKPVCQLVLSMKVSGVPLKQSELKVSAEDLKPYVDERFISLVMKSLFEKCVAKEVENDKDKLIEFVKSKIK